MAKIIKIIKKDGFFKFFKKIALKEGQ